MKISDSQFAEPGGGSRRLIDKEAPPAGGYFTSFATSKGGNERVAPKSEIAEHISSHYDESQSFLHSPQFKESGAKDTDIYQGKWVPDNDDDAFLDVSRHFPGKGGSSRIAALKMGVNHAQIAVWDANNDKSEDLLHTSGPLAGKPTQLGSMVKQLSRGRNRRQTA